MTDLFAMIVTAALFVGSLALVAKLLAPRYKREMQEKRRHDDT